MPLKPSYLLLLGGGAMVAVAGIKGYAPSKVFHDIISGTDPRSTPKLASQIMPGIAANAYGYGTNATLLSATSGSGAAGIVGLAETHPLPYQWAGDPSKGVADCSSWVNYIVGALAGLSIPGYPNGTYKGNGHGPNTVAWLLWGATGGMTKISQAQASAGDLVIWQTHMGIVVDNQDMISDLNPTLGVRQTSIAGGAPGGQIGSFWRLK